MDTSKIISLYFKSIAHNLASLLRFSGQDTRGQFWPYAITVFLLILAGFMSIVMPKIMVAMMGMMRDGQAPFPDFSSLLWWTVVMMLVMIFFLAAAVTRRLRDAGKPIGWALLPLVLVVVLLPLVGDPFTMVQLPVWAFFATFLLNIGYQASVIYLIVLLCGAGEKRAESAA